MANELDAERIARMFPEKHWKRLDHVPRLRGSVAFTGPRKATAYAVPVTRGDTEGENWRAGIVALGTIATIERPQLLLELFPDEHAVGPLATLLQELGLADADAVALYLPKF